MIKTCFTEQLNIFYALIIFLFLDILQDLAHIDNKN